MLAWVKSHIKRSVRILESQAAYRLWADDYQPSPHNALMLLEQQAMIDMMPALAGRMILDLACGTGRWGKYAQDQGIHLVFGIDQSYEMLKRGVLENVGVGDLAMVPFKNACFDIILCGLAIGHLPSDRMGTAIREMGRVLKPGGVALVSDLHPYQALRGAQRTFRTADGEVYAVEHYVHQYADYHRAANEVGLRITDVREPFHYDSKMRNMPIVLVLRLEKP